MARLKKQVVQRTYRVDPDAVAQEILFKSRMISLGRRSLLVNLRDGGAPTTNPHPASD